MKSRDESTEGPPKALEAPTEPAPEAPAALEVLKPKRTTKGRFVPGQSGNPGGNFRANKEAIERMRADSLRVWERGWELISEATAAGDFGAAVKAWELMLDRVLPKLPAEAKLEVETTVSYAGARERLAEKVSVLASDPTWLERLRAGPRAAIPAVGNEESKP